MSSGLMLAALTLTRTSLLPTLGSGTSAARTSFLPYRATTNAFMWSFLSSQEASSGPTAKCTTIAALDSRAYPRSAQTMVVDSTAR